MCGIIISSITIPENAKKFVEKRGPDKTNAITYNNINFLHFLLHLTGEQTLQPLIDYENEIVVIFNGEIYNYKELDTSAKSDVYSIMSTYKKYGNLSIKQLDGEFTIVIFDFKKNILLITSDIFKTKPLFYNIDNDIIIASYESSCKSIKNTIYNSIKPNETLIFDLNTRKLLEKLTVHDFDLNQYKDNYNDYINAFENAILKRYPDNSIPLITLSSGLDSGAITKFTVRREVEQDNRVMIRNITAPSGSKGTRTQSGGGYIIPNDLSLQQKENAVNIINQLRAKNAFPVTTPNATTQVS